MNLTIDTRKLKCLDGLHYSFEMLNLNYESLYDVCTKVTENQTNIIKALSQCWSIIDIVHRIREISQGIPGLNKNERKLLTFLQKTKEIEFCRHYIQHLRGELSKSNPFPVWGSLSWVDPQDTARSFIAVMGAQVEGIQYSGCVYDRLEKRWVSRVTLGVNHLSINFDPLYEATIEFQDFVIPWIIKNNHANLEIRHNIPIYVVKFIERNDDKNISVEEKS